MSGERDGCAWLVRPTQAPGRLERGQPLEVDGVRVTGIRADTRLRLPGLEVQAPAFETIARATDGELVLRDTDPSAPAARRYNPRSVTPATDPHSPSAPPCLCPCSVRHPPAPG